MKRKIKQKLSTCVECGGSGHVEETQTLMDGGHGYESLCWHSCYTCYGKGKVDLKKNKQDQIKNIKELISRLEIDKNEIDEEILRLKLEIKG